MPCKYLCETFPKHVIDIIQGFRFAETMLLVNMAVVLSRFTISLPSEKHVPVIEFTSGITRLVSFRSYRDNSIDSDSSHVKPFDIEIFPRHNMVDI